MRFDQQSNAVYVKNTMSMNDIQGVELYTVLKAMDVSLSLFCSFELHLIILNLSGKISVAQQL